MNQYPRVLKGFLIQVLLVSVTAVLAGCSFSDSSGSLSTSVESISDSTSSVSSSPSSTASKTKNYQDKVADYTVSYIKSSGVDGSASAFFRGLSGVAAKAGVSNWDQETDTYLGIGKGLKRADVEGAAYEAYKKQFSSNDPEHSQSIQDGYDSE